MNVSVKPTDGDVLAMACSFCGEPHDKVKRLIAGPTAYICNTCVALCVDLLDAEVVLLPATAPIDGAEDAARAAGCYLCLHCGSATLKERWGPGRITCPECQKQAPSVSEREAFFAERSKR